MTYVTDVRPVTCVCSQNAVQHIVVGPTLMIHKEIMKTMEQAKIHTRAHTFPETPVLELL